MPRQLYISREKDGEACYLSERPMPTEKRQDFPNYDSLLDFLNGHDNYAEELRARRKLHIVLAVPSEDLVELMGKIHAIPFIKPIIIPRTGEMFKLPVWTGDDRH